MVVRRANAVLSQWVKIPPGNCSSREQPEQSWWPEGPRWLSVSPMVRDDATLVLAGEGAIELLLASSGTLNLTLAICISWRLGVLAVNLQRSAPNTFFTMSLEAPTGFWRNFLSCSPIMK